MPDTARNAIKLEPSWLARLAPEFEQPYMQQLRAFLQSEKRSGKSIFPAGSEYFNAFEHTPLEAVKVVVLGQDPYHGPGQAHGLCFSVRPGVAIPPSLQNIYKEIHQELGLPIPAHGCLTHWADQGVLLLNSVLTVEAGRAASHQGKGWETFTDRVIDVVNREREGVVFLLWGSYAQRKGAIIDTAKHCVLKAPHPSPLSAHRGFFGCGHFRAANEYLQSRGETPIDWSLPEAP
ncbi:uracil-DNA glycosylase [Mangrovimicrobium sediminis]|uniref:Uracil-DNA glycosylase n=1 Tax=Mangrovimicrobium sediminis TaxID=2562682 RepID=A0A4Z0M4F7_9GAMM|nr:uracil-DNA glycosylase [Haliea sp. SAOS-164]TGD74573.1 uracil-DNA glycosylase [Haliea sp. SAOS-164]